MLIPDYRGNIKVYFSILNFFIVPVYLQSVQIHSVNWLKEVDECLGEGCSLALFYKLGLGQVPVVIWGVGLHLNLKTKDTDKAYF
jgi:hypothetical protein